MDKKRVLIFAKNIDGGTGTFASQFLRVYSSMNIELIRVLVLKKPRFFETILDRNVEFIEYEGPRTEKDYYDISWKTAKTLFYEAQWFKNQLDDFRPNVIVAIDTHCSLFAVLATQVWHKNIRTILTFHNNISAVTFYKLSKPARILLRILCGIFLNKASHVIGVSQGVAQDIKKYFYLARPVRFIPYGINTKRVDGLAHKNIDKQDKKVFENPRKTIISIGRFAPQKDFFTLIEAFKLVKEKIPLAQLVLLGDGEEKHKLMALVRSLGLKESVVFLGWKKNVYAYIKQSTVFVLSSNYEGFSYVLLESMAVGTPVVSTDTPHGPSELLGDGKYGKLVRMGDQIEMSKSIIDLIEDKALHRRYSLLAQKRSLDYPEEIMAKRYKDIIDTSFSR